MLIVARMGENLIIVDPETMRWNNVLEANRETEAGILDRIYNGELQHDCCLGDSFLYGLTEADIDMALENINEWAGVVNEGTPEIVLTEEQRSEIRHRIENMDASEDMSAIEWIIRDVIEEVN